MRAKIKRGERKRVVVIGGGLGGLRVVKALRKSEFQVVLIDKNNYHQFPPLIYQVSSAGLEPSNISFPFRRSLQDREDFFFRMGEVLSIDGKEKALQTTFGTVHYDYLVIAAGATTNFFGNENIEKNALPMKTVTEAMKLSRRARESSSAHFGTPMPSIPCTPRSTSSIPQSTPWIMQVCLSWTNGSCPE